MSAMESVVLAGNDNWDGGPDFWPIFPILWFLVVGGVIATIVITGRRHRERHGQRSGEARLAERYAAGEIDEAEYRERLGVLKEKR